MTISTAKPFIILGSQFCDLSIFFAQGGMSYLLAYVFVHTVVATTSVPMKSFHT